MKILCLESDMFNPSAYGQKGIIYNAEFVNGFLIADIQGNKTFVDKRKFEIAEV